jgi:parvulin-like peptidyl-prolyl isomerase
MKTKMKLIFPTLLAGALIALSRADAATSDGTMLTSATNSNPADTMAALFGDPVIAKGNGFEIKRSDLDEVMIGIKSAAAARNEPIPPEQLTGIEATMLSRLIQIQLLLQEATDADKAEGKAKAELQISNLLERAGSQETFERQLKAIGMSLDELRLKVGQEAVAMATLPRELGVSVAPAETKTFYDGHPAEFQQPEMVRVRHILILTMDPATRAPLPADQVQAKHKQIDDLLKRLNAGEDFSALAKQYSEDPGSKDSGGELPPFARGQNIAPEFEAAAFSLATNQISDVVTTSYGFHIIQLLDKVPAKKVDYALVGDKIKDFLLQQKIEKLAPPYLSNLKKAAGVEILDADLKAAVAAVDAAATNTPAATP